MKSLFAVSAVAVLSLSGCGAKLAPLTTAQKAEFAQTLSGVADPINASQVKKSTSNRSGPGLQSMSLAQDDSNGYIPADLSDDFSNNCESNFSYVGPNSSHSGYGTAAVSSDVFASASGYIRDLNGKVCPVALSVDLAARVESADHVALNFSLSYDIRHEEMKRFNDITNFAITGTGDIKKTGEAGGTIEFQSTGKITSQRNGEIQFYLNVNASGDNQNASGDVKLGMVFATYTAELRVTAQGALNSQNPELKFFLNDQQITQQEFMEFFAKFQDPRQNSGRDVVPSPGGDTINPPQPDFPMANTLKHIPLLSSLL